MKLLHLDASVLGDNSVSRQLSAAVVARLASQIDGLQVDYRDLDANPVPHLRSSSLAGTDAAEATDAEQVMQQFTEADIVVIGAPMYNFSIPSTLKAGSIAWPWPAAPSSTPRTARWAGRWQAGDHRQQPRRHLHRLAGRLPGAVPAPVFAFMGINEIEFVRAEGIAYSPQHREDAIAGALAALPSHEAAEAVAA